MIKHKFMQAWPTNNIQQTVKYAYNHHKWIVIFFTQDADQWCQVQSADIRKQTRRHIITGNSANKYMYTQCL